VEGVVLLVVVDGVDEGSLGMEKLPGRLVLEELEEGISGIGP